MEEETNYKELYETELNNRKLYEKRYNEIKKENVELQKSSGIAEIRKQLNEALDTLAFIREDRARLYVQLEDARNELDMLKSKKKGGKKLNGKEREKVLHQQCW